MLSGMIIIGVEDAKHTIVGVPDDRVAMTIDTILRAARQNVKPALILDPPEPELYELSGKRLVVAAVPMSRGPVYQSGGVFWVRRGTHTVPLDASELLGLLGDKGLVDWDHQPVDGAPMEDLYMGKVDPYLKHRSTRGRHPDRFAPEDPILVTMRSAL